jgi:hypothetical protein
MNKNEFENKLLTGPVLNYERRWEKGRIKFDIMPKDFLKYAEDNLSSTEDRDLVDTLSNTKRALDCQIELIIFEHGYAKKLKKENWNFPKKIKFLKGKHIIAPRILEKINKTRNLLEHEFRKPSVENVEDAFDVVTLFIGYSERLRRVPDSITIGLDPSTTKAFKVEFDKENLAFIVFDEANELFSVHEGDIGFERLLRLFYGTCPATYTLVHRSEIEDSTY